MAFFVNKDDPSQFAVSSTESRHGFARALRNPLLQSLYATVASYYIKMNADETDVVEMDAGEKATVDAARAAAQETSEKEAADSETEDNPTVRRYIKALLKVIRVMDTRNRNDQSQATLAQMVQFLKDEIDNG